MITDASVSVEKWPLARPFVIARGITESIDLVVVHLADGSYSGRGESCPVDHYGESTESVTAAVREITECLLSGEAWDDLHDEIPAGAARNAVDCAHWDLASNSSGQRVWSMLGLDEPRSVFSVLTIGLGDPRSMANAARDAAAYPILKLKLNGDDDIARVEAVRAARPGARLIVDANEAWDPEGLAERLRSLAKLGVEMVEQPLPAGRDAVLAEISHAIPIAADESCHTARDILDIERLYDVINIKLDKSGGLTEAMRVLEAARQRDLGCMVGCMLGTSLAMAPALLVAQACEFVDLDAPLLIGRDREPALNYEGGTIFPADQDLWG